MTKTKTAAKPDFRFIDLFAGIGGFRFALESLGGECVYTVERDKFARKTYAAWHGEDETNPNFAADMQTDVDPEQVPDHDVLAAGFPCQPFSLAGVSKKNSLGRSHGFQDLTQGTLFFNICEILVEKRPAVLILENVKHLLRHDKGETFRVIKESLEDLEYTVSFGVVSASAWVPQKRERILIVGIDKRRFPEMDIDTGSVPFEFPAQPEGDGPVLADILQDIGVDTKYTLTPKLWAYLKAYRLKHERAGNGFGFSTFGPEDVARTISARYHKDGSEILISQPARPDGRPRRLTPQEAQALMGFDEETLGREPGSLPIVVSDTQAYRQFGNAVVPAVVKHVASAVLDHLNEHVEDWTAVSPGDRFVPEQQAKAS